MRVERCLLFSMIVSVPMIFSWANDSRAEDAPTLTKDNGPYMVRARSFRWPEAEVMAQALASELRKDYGLPAYIYRIEQGGVISEIVVLVGDAKTDRECREIQARVKKIKPTCLKREGMSSRRNDLSTATQTTNPLATIE